ncbi:MAG TPA: hypothetical protein VGA86_11700 [Desulfatiglandales bacterium]
MKNNVGLWIDHRQAVIVNITGEGGKTRRIVSGMEKRVRFSRAARDASAEDQRDRRYTGRLRRYYDKVISSLRNADAILILGPGEAKGELKARLESQALGGRIAGVVAVDKMTDRQLEARVCQHFSES